MLEPENREFVRLMKAAGWSQNETARRLQMTGGGVSQICNGKIRPSKGRLNLLQLLVERERPGTMKLGREESGLEGWTRDLSRDLQQMPQGQRAAVQALIRQLMRVVGGPGRRGR
jgi:transcriptional regulator with XRE-family HTH domain